MSAGKPHFATRRDVLRGSLGIALLPILGTGGVAEERPTTDATFIFTNDVHACRMASGLSPHCEQEGKTDANLLRHIAALNRLPGGKWPLKTSGKASGLAGAGQKIETPLGVVIGGDMTDDGGGQVTLPSEGTQLLQFSHRYQQGMGADRVHFPVYAGLGNHDLDQDGPAPQVDWYRREMRDYVEINHRPSVFFKPPVPATNYDVGSDCYSWDWGGLHLVQTHRFAGDTAKGAINGLPWLKDDLATYAGDGRPVILFQHYGWDPFSLERWDPSARTFDTAGAGRSHWWSREEQQALLTVLSDYNIIGIFHGHEHDTALIYQHHRLDIFKPKAAFKGGFALAHVTDRFMDVTLGEAVNADGEVVFTNAFSKPLTTG
ncbi:metallophosphoesterase [Pseudaminobacter salicylatoxidans]|uniref:metallophosphoesterase n=1 Tax=Pseudaminobacter salicylatoxidans TaxID=93369 RepID=UPI0003002D82|nr:metallophosphoesterase [Pseudaminobacter salicylatoxidans]